LFKHLLLKELKLIGRAKNGFLSMVVLMMCMVFIFHFSMEKHSNLRIEELIGLKWSIIFILSFVYMGQSNWEERESGAYRINRIYIPFYYYFLIKSFTVWIVLVFLETLLVVIFALFFKEFPFNLSSFYNHLILLVPATLSLSFLGNSLSQLSFATRLKEIVLPLLLIPLSIPLLIFGIEAERKLLSNQKELLVSLGILLALSIIYASVGILSEEITKED
jgi:heme exporter protein B